jgi:hypothetical protein
MEIKIVFGLKRHIRKILYEEPCDVRGDSKAEL